MGGFCVYHLTFISGNYIIIGMGKHLRNSVFNVRAKQAFPVVGAHIDRLAITLSMEFFNAPRLI